MTTAQNTRRHLLAKLAELTIRATRAIAPMRPIPAMAAAALVLAAGSSMAADAAPIGWHPAMSSRPVVVSGIDPNTFIVGHPASPTTRAGHANGEHPAVLVAQGARTQGIDANTFIVQPPVQVTWRDAPSSDDGTRYAQAGRSPL